MAQVRETLSAEEIRSADRGAAAAAATHRTGDQGLRPRGKNGRAILRTQGFPLPRTRHQLPDCPRRRPEAEGDLLHPRGRVSGGRNEARTDRADRREHAGRRDRPRRPCVREDGRQCPGGKGARRIGHRRDNGGRPAHGRRPRRNARRDPGDAAHDAAADTGDHDHPAATARVPHRGAARLRRRSAAQPRQVGHGGVAST